MTILILILLAISLAIHALLVAVATIIVKKIWFSNRQRYQHRTYQHREPVAVNRQRSTYNTSTPSEPKHGDISPTGWIYNGTTKLWEPPQDKNDTQNRWLWDPKKRIWIDLKKAPKKEPNPDCPVKLDHRGPTYEEWKNQRYKEVYEKLTEEAERREKEKENPRD